MCKYLTDSLEISLPEWAVNLAAQKQYYLDDADKMGLAVALAERNIRAGGGPFGAAVFEIGSGKVMGVGLNLVVPAGNSTLHAEMVAIMMAEAVLGRHSLSEVGRYELFTSCAPCAMCLGGILWAGVERLVCAAEAEDARQIGFDEGPVFEESYDYLKARGVTVVRGFMREAGSAVLRNYATQGGQIYNGR
jgi:tRNA(Arg) A34 adenosine deaminase TadA